MIQLGTYNVGAGAQTIPCDKIANGTIKLYNESGYLLQVTIPGYGSDYLPAWTGDVWPLPPTFGGSVTVTPQSISSATGAPSSLVTATGYGKGERVPGQFPVSLARQVAVGNQVSTTTNPSVQNDGNAAGTSVVEATQSGNTGGSNVSLLNDGTFTLAQWASSTLTKLLQVIPGAATALKLGSAATTVETLGNAQVDGALTVTGAIHGTADNASAVPAAGVAAGTLGAGVIVPAANVSGTVGSASSASSVPATGVTAGNLPSTVNVQGDWLEAADATKFLSIKDNATNATIEVDANAAAGTARGVQLAGMDTAGVLHEILRGDGTGLATLGASGVVSLLSAINFNVAMKTVINGTSGGAMSWAMPWQGDAFKLILMFFNAYKNTTATPQQIALPADSAAGYVVFNMGVGSGTMMKFFTAGDAPLAYNETTWGSGTGSGSQNTATGLGANFSSAGYVGPGALHFINLPCSNSISYTGFVLMIGY